MLAVAICGALSCCGAPEVPSSVGAFTITSFPTTLDPECGDGRARLYDECGSQRAILEQALAEARASNRVVLVNYGAEWCIWCHVFDAHMRGETGSFRYPVESQEVTLVERSSEDPRADARALNEFVSRNIVVVHIEGDNAPDGWEVLDITGASERFNDYYPFVFTLSSDGRVAAVFDYQKAEVRRDTIDWYRGYDRRALFEEVSRMVNEARVAAPHPTPD